MCKLKEYQGTSNTKIDDCIRTFIKNLQAHSNLRLRACCCGHGKYPITILADIGFSKVHIIDLVSGKEIPRTRKFYKKDSKGYYYIPEVSLLSSHD